MYIYRETGEQMRYNCAPKQTNIYINKRIHVCGFINGNNNKNGKLESLSKIVIQIVIETKFIFKNLTKFVGKKRFFFFLDECLNMFEMFSF